MNLALARGHARSARTQAKLVIILATNVLVSIILSWFSHVGSEVFHGCTEAHHGFIFMKYINKKYFHVQQQQQQQIVH